MIEVVAAIIFINDKILCLKRGKGKFEYTSYKYEFPGGKIETGETHQNALKREILEELNLKITVNEKFATIKHIYPDFQIKLHCYFCETNEFNGYLTEHIDYKILDIYKLDSIEWVAADIKIIQMLKDKQ